MSQINVARSPEQRTRQESFQKVGNALPGFFYNYTGQGWVGGRLSEG